MLCACFPSWLDSPRHLAFIGSPHLDLLERSVDVPFWRVRVNASGLHALREIVVVHLPEHTEHLEVGVVLEAFCPD